MRTQFRTIALSLIVAFAGAACSTPQLPKVDTSKPLEVNRGFFADPIRQDGKILDGKDTLMQLSATKEGAHALRNLDLTATSGLIVSGVAGYLIGYGAFSSDTDKRGAFIGTGAALFIGSLGILNMAKQQLANSADIYNKRFKTMLTPLQGGGAALVQTTF